MVRKLLRSVREYKRDSFFAPLFVSLEVVMEVLIPFLPSFLPGQRHARLTPGFDAFEEIGHVAAEEAHDLHPFQILLHLRRGVSMNHIPIPANSFTP